LFATPITFQEVLAGQLRISLDMQYFRQPLSVSLQSMALLSLILLAAALWLSLLVGRSLASPLTALGHWVHDPQGLAPGARRQDEIGELARSLQARLAPLPEPEPEQDLDPETDPGLILDDEPELEPAWQPEPGSAPPRRAMAHSLDEDDPFLDLDEVTFDAAPTVPAPFAAAETGTGACAVLAVQHGQQDQLRRLPRQRLVDQLDRYRHCL